MLTISRNSYLAGGLTALVVLAAGITVAATTTQSRPAGDPVSSALAAQGGGSECPDPSDPRCYVFDEDEEETGGDRGGNGGGGGRRVCTFDTGDGTITVADRTARSGTGYLALVAQSGVVEIPCVHPELGFYADGCYWGEPPTITEPPDPPEGSDPEDGRMLWGSCIASVIGQMPNQSFILFASIRWQWFESAEVVAITPDQVALDWLASVELHGVEHQLAPPETGAGLIGLPVWLGIDETATSWGPISDSHCIQGVCVSIEAQVTEVDWAMGDGNVVTCTREQHVGWRSGMDFRTPGDNCHHYYQRASRGQPDGKYQITATSHWEIHWEAEASAVEGDLSTEREATVGLQINEIQVLTR